MRATALFMPTVKEDPADAEATSHKLMVREKEEAVRLRDLFNSVASHELKTPLSALVLQLQRASHALEKGTCPPSETCRPASSAATPC